MKQHVTYYSEKRQQKFNPYNLYVFGINEYENTNKTLTYHLNQLRIEENPVLSKLTSLLRDITNGDICRKYKKIVDSLSPTPNITMSPPQNINLQNKETFETIKNFYLNDSLSDEADEIIIGDSRQSKEIAGILRQLERLIPMIGDDTNFHKKQKKQTKTSHRMDLSRWYSSSILF